MKEANTSVGYAVAYHALAEIARSHGYALALHGSMLTDLDVVAIPWTNDAVDEVTLLNALKRHLGLCDLLSEDIEKGRILGLTEKPHGRLAWKIITFPAGSVDLSIMPRLGMKTKVEAEIFDDAEYCEKGEDECAYLRFEDHYGCGKYHYVALDVRNFTVIKCAECKKAYQEAKG